MLHGKEAVLNEEQLGHLASSMSKKGPDEDLVMRLLADENIAKAKEESGIKPEHYE